MREAVEEMIGGHWDDQAAIQIGLMSAIQAGIHGGVVATLKALRDQDTEKPEAA